MVHWSPEDIEILTKIWNEGGTGSTIAALTGKSRGAVMGKIRTLGLQRNKTFLSEIVIVPLPKSESDPTPVSQPVAKPLKPFRVPPPLPTTEIKELASEAPQSNWVAFIDLEHHHCKWIVSGDEGPTMCCGETRVHDRPYCTKHVKIGYEKNSARPLKLPPAHRRRIY